MKQMADGRSKNNSLGMIKVSYKSSRHKHACDFLWTRKDEEEEREERAMLVLERRLSRRIFY